MFELLCELLSLVLQLPVAESTDGGACDSTDEGHEACFNLVLWLPKGVN